MSKVYKFDLSGCDNNQPQDCWLASTTVLVAVVPQGLLRGSTLRIELESGPAELYDYLPFCVSIEIDGNCIELLEFDRAFQALDCRVPVLSYSDRVSIVARSELFKSPKKSGIGNDERELSVRLSCIRLLPPDDSADASKLWSPFVSAGVVSRALTCTPLAGTIEPLLDDRLRCSLVSEYPRSHPQPEPVFVVGAYRSATSALTWALGQHPDIFAMDETGWLGPLALGAFAGYARASGADRPATEVYRLTEHEFLGCIAESINSLHQNLSEHRTAEVSLQRLSGRDQGFDKRFQLARSLYRPKRMWVDGTPEYSGYIPLLAKIFPKSKFIVSIRQPEQVVNSLLNIQSSVARAMTPEGAFEAWESLTRYCLESALSLGPTRVAVLSFDELLREPQMILDQVFGFLGRPRFRPAGDVFSVRINSSFTAPQTEYPDALSSPENGRYREIYDGIFASKRLADLPWARPFDPSWNRMNDLIIRTLRVTG